jgi:beta-phosphoglucomutase-like phosphatase (HAD superfamily)
VTRPEQPFETGRARPIVTSLDVLRPRIDHDSFDAVIFTLKAVAADLGYGDVRALPGSVAWIDRLRTTGKRIAVVSEGERASAALEIARIDNRVDVVVTGPNLRELFARALDELELTADRVLGVGVEADELEAARDARVELVIAVARGSTPPERLRHAGAIAVLADLQELLTTTAR